VKEAGKEPSARLSNLDNAPLAHVHQRGKDDAPNINGAVPAANARLSFQAVYVAEPTMIKLISALHCRAREVLAAEAGTA
jgi:hypothetical protein